MKAFRDIQSVLTLLCGVSLALSFFGVHPWLPYAAVLFGSYFALKSAWESLRDRSIDVNFLMVFAALGAILLGHPLEAAVLLFLFSLSSTLEHFAMSRTKNAIEGLIRLRPDKAILVGESGDQQIDVSSLKVGDSIRILPFEGVPADGVVESGESSVDQHVMTGESVPVPKAPGDKVLAGTQNMDGMLLVRVTAAVGDTTLEKIVDLVRDAQENKASGERISQWFGQRYTFFVLGAFALSLIVRLLIGQPWNAAAYGALTLLVALSPCALVISTPASTLSALAWAARNGILIRGGEFIELAGKVDTVAIDKTGTLTEGRPALAEICVCTGVPETVGATGSLCVEEESCWTGGPNISPEARELLRAAAAAEQYSTHPIAEAIVAKAREFNIEVPEAADAKAHAGLGVSATIDGKLVRIGQRRFFEEDGEALDPEFALHAEELQAKGMTVAVLEYGGRMAALGLRDEPRKESIAVLKELKELGVDEQVMLTGDTIQTAEAVSKVVGLSRIHAGLMPDQKTALIDEMGRQGRTVMMVGDGVNDAPSLAKAAVGVAMGGLGSDVALNAADIVLMNDKLDRIPKVIRLGRLTNRIIRANLIFAAGMIVFLTVGSFVFDQFLPQYRNLLLPFAVVGHEGSTVLVILNGLRLLKGP
jgi:Cd2+/Zn2+-exporting ATPase